MGNGKRHRLALSFLRYRFWRMFRLRHDNIAQAGSLNAQHLQRKIIVNQLGDTRIQHTLIRHKCH